MTRGCTIENCQRTPAKKSVCCGRRLCTEHAESAKAHDCPRAAELGAIASDPKLKRLWLTANGPEGDLTAAVILAMRAMSELGDVWQGKKRGVRESDLVPGLPDVLAYARECATLVGVETKRTHKPDCICASCEDQRAFAERLVASGGVYVKDVRNVQQAVDGVRMGLARARGKQRGKVIDNLTPAGAVAP